MIIYRGKFLTLRLVVDSLVVSKKNAVAFLLVDMKRRLALLCSQRRRPMVCSGNPRGIITEAAAGTRDYRVGIKQLVADEARQETGKRVTAKQVKLLNRGKALATSPGWTTERLWLACVKTDLKSCLKDNT